VLASDVVDRRYQTQVVLTAGAFYNFKVEARNSVGYSPASAEFEILAAQPPSKPDAPITTANGGNIIVTWTAPFHGGSAITGYRILFRHDDGVSFSENAAICDGQT
jgi:hypothetical protein